jgi:hypothetical protein
MLCDRCECVCYRYAGEVFGIVNTIGTLSGIIAPIIVSILTPNVSWSVVNLIIVKKLRMLDKSLSGYSLIKLSLEFEDMEVRR